MARVVPGDEEAAFDCEGGEVMLRTELHEPCVGHFVAHLDNLSRLCELDRFLGGGVLELFSLALNWSLLHYLLRLRLDVSWRLARLGLAL